MNQTKPPASPVFLSAIDGGMAKFARIMNSLAQGTAALFELSGNFLAGLLDAVGKVFRGLPALGKLLHVFFHWLGTIFSAGFDLAAMLLSSAINLLADGVAGTVRILTGALGSLQARDGQLVRKGTVDILSGIAGAVIAVAGKTVALIHAALFMQMGERPLTEYEKTIVKRVYRGSIALQKIRIIEGFAGLYSTNNRPFALGNRIYMKHHDSAKNPGLFAHECCHVWQYQRAGVRYLIEALWAQWKVEKPYSWEAEIKRGNVRWQDFNREAQAQFVQDIYDGGRQIPPHNTKGEFYDADPIGADVEYIRNGVDHTDLARETIMLIRNKG